MKTISLSGQTVLSINGKSYLLLDEIGKGGYGKVYSALQVDTDKRVAIKTLHFKTPLKPYFKQQYISRFIQEIKMGGLLHHPNIMQLLDYGYWDNKEPFAVFEWIQGHTLNDYIFRHKAIAPHTTQVIMLQLLDALIEVHNKGILHCDLKPQNVMWVDNLKAPMVKLFDFGSSIFSRSSTIDENTNSSILTTAHYASPEQLRGNIPTQKSDIYAWGLILLECLTGRPVIQGTSIASALKHQLSHEDVPIPKGIFSKALKELLNKVLQKDPEQRIESVASLKTLFSKIDFSKIIVLPNAETNPAIHSLDADTGVRPLG